MTFDQIKTQDKAYILPTYGRVDVALVQGKNARAWDAEGKEYIDFTAGIGVNALGYSDLEWAAAVAEQAGKIQHLCNYYYSPENTALAQALCQAAGMGKAFFCNSGAEANECAVKVARKYGEKRGASQIVTLINSFHGRTLTTLAATGQDGSPPGLPAPHPGLPLRRGRGPARHRQAAGRLRLRRAAGDGSRGRGASSPWRRPSSRAWPSSVRSGTCSCWWTRSRPASAAPAPSTPTRATASSPTWSPPPRASPGACPWAPCLVSKALGDILTPGQNGSTFGGNPVACAGARVVVRRVSDPAFLQSVTEKGAYLKARLESLPQVEYVRGKGLMLGAKLKDKDAHEVLVQCAGEGLLVLTAKDLVRFLPPLNHHQRGHGPGLAIFQRVLEA